MRIESKFVKALKALIGFHPAKAAIEVYAGGKFAMDSSSMRLAAQPLHLQLRRALLRRIASGEWRHGDVIPNENQLAREFNLSAGTVRKALDWMEQARLVVRQQGRGTFITDPMSPELAGRFDTLHGADGLKLVTIPEMLAK